MIYSIGHNIAGYLPESDVAWYADRGQAIAQLVSDMREYAERDDEASWEALPGDAETARAHGYAVTDEGVDYGDDAPSMLAQVESVLADDGPDESETAETPWYALIEDGSGRRIAFWLHAEEFVPEYAVTRGGLRAEVEKTGGGTVGREYDGYWRYVVRYADDGELVTCGIDFHSGTPITHYVAACRVLEMAEESESDD